MGKFSSGFFWGALIAGTHTLLNAKRSGQETRRLLAEYLEQAKVDASVVQRDLEQVQVSVKHLMDDIVPLTKKITQQVQTELRQFEEANRPRVRRVQAKLNALQTHLEDETSEF